MRAAVEGSGQGHGRWIGRTVLCTWRGVRVPAHPALLFAGTATGLLVGNLASHAAGLDASRVYLAMLLLLVPGLVGARLAHVAMHWPRYRRAPRRIWRRAEGGAALLGGLPPMLLASLPLCAALELSWRDFWDVTSVALLSAIPLARLGCLLHGCCAGRPSASRLALLLPDHRGVWRRRLPTQLLEALLAAVLLPAALWLWSRTPPAGVVFAATLAAFALGRVLLDPLRAQRARLAASSANQLLAGALCAFALADLARLTF